MKILSFIKTTEGHELVERNLTKEPFEKEGEVWVHIEVNDRTELAELGANEDLQPELINRLLLPGKSFRLERIGQFRLMDCNVNYSRETANLEYLTFVFYQDKLITVSSSASEINSEVIPDKVIDIPRDYTSGLIALLIIGRLIDHNARYAKSITQQVDKGLKMSISQHFNLATGELEDLYAYVIDYNELFEDQLTPLRVIPLEVSAGDPVQGVMNRMEQSMAHLVNLTSRSIDKLDYIFQRQRSVLQEKGNTRLNTLTVVQSIFVPLTFIAGIYGMNFDNIPELHWPDGYFYTWGLMIIIAVASLYGFYRNGWFKSD